MNTQIDPLTHEYAAIQWLLTHKGSMSYALDHWERVELVRATADNDDAFYWGGKAYRVLNPGDFDVSDFADTVPMIRDAEPWDMPPPDIEPPPLGFISDAELCALSADPPVMAGPAVRAAAWIAIVLGMSIVSVLLIVAPK